jgi:putative FmdB family regulatory protein
MPVYEYRCRSCDDVFELSRPMSQSSDPASCPQGHPDAVKLLSRVLVMSGRPGAGPSAGPTMASGGGCCGGGCGCH